MISFKCDACGARFKLTDDYAGRSGSCPKCKAKIQVPRLDGQSAPPPVDKPKKPTPGQDVAIVRDRQGGICGLWVRQTQVARDSELLSMVSIRMGLPDDLGAAILAGRYRVVPNEHDDAGGCFTMFGDAIAPGENQRPPAAEGCCDKCGKSLAELSSGVFSGDAVRSMLDATSYACKSCGTPFCIDCMREIKTAPCPRCGGGLGW